MIATTELINRDYYNKTYTSKYGLFFSTITVLISYDQQSKSKLNVLHIERHLKTSKSKPLSILDYGFGRGSLLLKMPSDAKLYGCDISDEAVVNFPRLAKIFGKKVTTFFPIQLNDFVEDSSLDIIFCSHVLEHVPDDIEILSNLRKKLRNDGILLINIPINEIWEDPKHVRKYTLDIFREIANRIGLNILEHHEENSMDNFLLTHEITNPNYAKKLLFRPLRAFLAIMPLSLLRWVNRHIVSRYKPAQLICTMTKIL